MNFQFAKRIKELPPYLFAEIDRLKEEQVKKGVKVIDLGVGDPDIPTPRHIVEALKRASEKKENHRYPSYIGMLSFREAAAEWYKNRFGVNLDPVTEVVTLIGSKEGIAHLPWAFIDPGDISLVPDPAYPVYGVATKFAGGEVYKMPLLEKNGFLPDLDAIPEDVAKRAKLLFLNYPNNPTTAEATEDFYKKAIEFAKKFEILLVSDAPYTEIYYDPEKKPISLMQVEGAKDVAIEFHSLSKTYNMTGWRIGFAVGNRSAIAGLGKVKTNVDSGVFQAIQEAGIEALLGDQGPVEQNRQIYKERREAFIKGLEKLGLDYVKSNATFYLWIKVPEGFTSSEFTKKVLEEAGVVVTPGVGFGEYGEGYFRVSLTQETSLLKEAIERITTSLKL